MARYHKRDSRWKRWHCVLSRLGLWHFPHRGSIAPDRGRQRRLYDTLFPHVLHMEGNGRGATLDHKLL
jgi:hypothetical protein